MSARKTIPSQEPNELLPMIIKSVVQMICDLISVALYLHWYIAQKSRCRPRPPTPPRDVQPLPRKIPRHSRASLCKWLTFARIRKPKFDNIKPFVYRVIMLKISILSRLFLFWNHFHLFKYTAAPVQNVDAGPLKCLFKSQPKFSITAASDLQSDYLVITTTFYWKE